MANIVFDTYGKTRVRLTYVDRSAGAEHELKEMLVEIFFEGAFQTAFTKGDNSVVLPTDTIKNTVYALARKKMINSIEEFARDLARHFLNGVKHLNQVRIEIRQTPWARIGKSPTAFIQTGNERRTSSLTATRTRETFVSGTRDLQILKTAGSGFSGFMKDEFTTLAETNDRLFGTVLQAEWRYAKSEVNFNQIHTGVRDTLLSTFSAHNSVSVQQTLFDMASDVLRQFPEIEEVHLTMPNKHCLLVDLSKFGMDNPNQVFLPIDEPSGYIEARVAR